VPEAPPSPLVCARCDYDLRTIAESGVCPECGLPVDESIRVLGGWTRPRLFALRYTIWAYLLSVVTWCGFGIALARTPTLTLRVFAAVVLAIHATCLCYAAIAGTYSSSRQRKPLRAGIVWGLTFLIAMAGLFVILAALRAVSIADATVKSYFVIAAITRVVLGAFAAWWLIMARQSLMHGGSALGKWSIASLGLVIAAWAALGIALGAGYLWSTWLWSRVELLGGLAVGLDPLASLFIACVSLTMLRLIKERLAASEPRGTLPEQPVQ